MDKKYSSKYTDSKITSAQFLAETICERIALRDKKVLTYKFWQSEEWKKIFIRQVGEASKLLREADIVQIMTFLRSPKGKKIYSLGLKKEILLGVKNIIKSKKEQPILSPEESQNLLEDSYVPAEVLIARKTKTPLWEILQ